MERSAKLSSLKSESFRVSGFKAVGRRDIGKALIRSLEVAFGRDGAEIHSDCKVL
jgi:hypothetical protein